MKQLVAANAEIDAITHAGRTPLHWAAYDNNESIAKFLLTLGANVDTKDKEGNTPLHLAALAGNNLLVQLFLEKGANCSLSNKKNQTPADLARENGKPQVAKLILDHSHKINDLRQIIQQQRTEIEQLEKQIEALRLKKDDNSNDSASDYTPTFFKG